ncbi:unnamed protein product [Hermetia illucens]|uniref:Uncharacterized protein n=2 Tax=Hermetia illucens TaxID=343691 RepID=A0A7R8V2H0_HERIL|nr:unnamed protein product [Hermetia illucens]
MSQYQCKFDPIQKTWSGKKYVSILNPQVSLGHVLLNMMDRDPDKVIQISADSGIKYTNHDIKVRAIRACRFYYKYGLKQGDVIGLMAANSANLAPIVLASYITGIPYNCLDVSFGSSEIEHMYATTKPKIVFCDEAVYPVVESGLKKIGLTSTIYIINGHVENVPHVTEFLECDDDFLDDFVCPVLGDPKDVPGAIICSSGTTGLPKGVYVSQASLVLCAEISPVRSSDILLCFSTMYWYSGVFTLIVSLMAGATRIVTTEKVSSDVILRLIEEYKVTFYISPPSQMAMLLQDPHISVSRLESIRTYLCGGSKVLSNLVQRMNKYLKNGSVFIMYGMTEVGSMITLNPGNEPLESVGLAIPNIQMKIVNDEGNVVDTDVDGEVLIKPPYPFLGYYGQPDATKDIFDEDGWIHSGDVGHFDKQGYLILVDRKKDILKYRNYHYFPSEIENVLMEIPDIAQICVCGIPEEDGSDLPAALVVKAQRSNITEKDIADHLEGRVADYKKLRGGIYFTDSIPMTASGKYQRRVAREICTKLFRNKQGTSNSINGTNVIRV